MSLTCAEKGKPENPNLEEVIPLRRSVIYHISVPIKTGTEYEKMSLERAIIQKKPKKKNQEHEIVMFTWGDQ